MNKAIFCALLAIAPLLAFQSDKPKTAEKAGDQATQQPPKSTPASSAPILPASPSDAPADPGKMAEKSPPPAASVAPSSDKLYRLGPEDVIQIAVWNNPGLSGMFRIRPDGRIAMPLIGEVVAGGLTCAELQAAIRDKLKEDVIIDPQVTVGLNEVHSKKYYIQGGVMRPGAFDLAVPIRVLEALVNGGGFRDFADEKHIRIRHENGKIDMFNYRDVIKGKHPEQNIFIQPGDIIIVKE